MNCKLTKLSNNNNDLRTNEVEGHCDYPPQVGDSFTMYAKSLDHAYGFRLVQTSPIVSIAGETFTTESGTLYKWEQLDGI